MTNLKLAAQILTQSKSIVSKDSSMDLVNKMKSMFGTLSKSIPNPDPKVSKAMSKVYDALDALGKTLS